MALTESTKRFFKKDRGLTAWAGPWEKEDDVESCEIRYSMNQGPSKEFIAGVVNVRKEDEHKIIEPVIHIYSNVFFYVYAHILDEALDKVY